jgi:glycosyltransferase involved in cell wall biosynthesis
VSRLVVLPADPLFKYVEKGEIKSRYWNPDDFFDEVHLVSLSDTDVQSEKVKSVAGNARLFIHVVGRPTFWSFPLFFSKVKKTISSISPDVIRAHGPWHTGSLAVYAGRSLGIPSIVSIHSNRDEQRRMEPSLLLNLVRPLENYSLANASTVLCVSDYLHAYAQIHGATRTFTIYNKVYTDRFKGEHPYNRPGPLKALSVMRLDRAKYPECLLEAIAPLDIHLTLIGQGELENALHRQVAELGIAERVEFIRQVPNSEIHSYYDDADIFLMATHYEGFCIPVLEAMAAGLPVIASDTGPIPEVLGGTGWIVQKEPRAFTEALTELIHNPDRRAAMGKAARQRALQIDGKIMEERECEFYNALLSGDGPELEEMLSETRRYVN